jgi:hypothetical protein
MDKHNLCPWTNFLYSEYNQLLLNFECVPKGAINDHVHEVTYICQKKLTFWEYLMS